MSCGVWFSCAEFLFAAIAGSGGGAGGLDGERHGGLRERVIFAVVGIEK